MDHFHGKFAKGNAICFSLGTNKYQSILRVLDEINRTPDYYSQALIWADGIRAWTCYLFNVW